MWLKSNKNKHMKNKIMKAVFFYAVFQFMIAIQSFSQTTAAALAAADSTRFSVDLSGGWLLFNSYVSLYHTDSVQIELIVQHNNNVNWYTQQYVGKIKYNPLKPGVEQSLSFKIINNIYKLTIKSNGKCFVNFVSGIPPSGNPVIIPLKVFYKL